MSTQDFIFLQLDVLWICFLIIKTKHAIIHAIEKGKL